MYYTFIDLRLPVEGDTVSGCLAHYLPPVNDCATTADSLGNIGPYTSEKMWSSSDRGQILLRNML